MSSLPASYKELADAIYHGDNSLRAGSFDEKVTLTEAVVVNGGKACLPANTALRIQRPVSVQ